MDAAPFELHPRLAADSHFLRDLELSRVLLMDDARFAWLILVPMRSGMRDWIDLAHAEQHRLLDEVERCSRALRACVRPDKLNVAALGNMVPQLHVHVVARHVGDAAWPKPVWGVGEAAPYAADALAARKAELLALLESAPRG
ncbi:MAG: HIT domain-containing protein [Proteobacteria bacterium]|uniref:HIT domain-containing protein n=1 Tax=Rudaea sp. TaxID=2136325 RepID=UPI00321F81C2|nr:HIT domain-containing protein [Pseudomonadota bacterium]